MPVRLITYDLKKESSSFDYTGLYAFIKQHAWARLSESSYAIDTTASPLEIYNQLKPYIDSNDSVLVMTLTSPWNGQQQQEVIDWLQQRIPVA